MPDAHDHVRYDLVDGVATITMDDGKANAMSPAMLGALGEALDQAEADDAVVVLRGRQGVFSAGYDLKVFQSGDGDAAIRMLRGGGGLVGRLLAFPRPVLAACTGHAIAQGAFTLLAADVRIGLDGEFRFGFNEVSLGLVPPHYAVAVCRHRMRATDADLALNTGRMVGPAQAQSWGLLDDLAPDVEAFEEMVAQEAARLTTLVPQAHQGTRERTRGALVSHVAAVVEEEFPLG